MQRRRLMVAAALAGLAAMLPPAGALAPLPTDKAREWLVARMPPPDPPPPRRVVSAAERECLARNVYWESRGEPPSGQEAVAHVTLNRVAAPGFPASICGVVHQSCQFGWTCDDIPDTPTDAEAWRQSLAVADATLAGKDDPTGGALFFHTLAERPRWVQGRYAGRVTIGNHVFFGVREPQVAGLP